MTNHTTRPLLGCIADDFTGATDLANMLVRGGMRTVQSIGIPSREVADGLDADAIVIALKSRTTPVAEAVEESLAALDWLREQGCEQIFLQVLLHIRLHCRRQYRPGQRGLAQGAGQ